MRELVGLEDVYNFRTEFAAIDQDSVRARAPGSPSSYLLPRRMGICLLTACPTRAVLFAQDGFLSETEVASFFGEDHGAKHIEQIWESCDVDGNATCTMPEYVLAAVTTWHRSRHITNPPAAAVQVHRDARRVRCAREPVRLQRVG